MEKQNIIEALKMQPLTEEEKASRHILGRLCGPIATSKEGTRNGRKYNRELWENALGDPLMREKIKNKSLFLELGHPLDGREETIMANACACIPEMPKIVDGDLIAYVDILDTPNGRILKTLCDYGFVPGISSRGTGDVIGDEVDPETFNLETWDIVQLPAVESARLTMTESLDCNRSKLKTALIESLSAANAEDKKIMEESLQNLGIDDIDSNGGNALDIKPEATEAQEPNEAESKAGDAGLEEAIRGLQEAIGEKSRLEEEVRSLQEQLAVSNAKVGNLSEELSKYRSATARLSSIASERKRFESENAKLNEELAAKENIIKQKDIELSGLRESRETDGAKADSLNESLTSRESEIKSLNESLASLKEDYEAKISGLNESLEGSKAKIDELTDELTESARKADGWKKTAVSIVSSYITSKARMLGLEENQIRNMLPESYCLKDIDEACEKLTESNLNRSRLPFALDRKVSKITVNESKSDAMRRQVVNDDDEVDEGLLRMSGLR